MSEEVDWALDQLASVVDSQPGAHPLRRVDRDDAQVYETDATVDMETPIHTRTGKLETANIVGVSLADRAPEAIGTSFDYQLETVLSVRIEGAHHSAYGHIDPAGVDGVPFTGTDGLVPDIRAALLAGRTFPDAGRSSVDYTDVRTANEANQSSNYSDYYRYDFDLVFRGYEEL